MKSIGKVLHLFVSNEQTKERLEKLSLNFDPKGILQDKFYNKDIQRSVLITSKDSYILTQKYNIDMPYGSLGENLLIDYNPYLLREGSILQIGDIQLEISQNCTICEHLSIIDKRLPTLLEKDRGIFAKVIKEGELKKGDKIYPINEI